MYRADLQFNMSTRKILPFRKDLSAFFAAIVFFFLITVSFLFWMRGQVYQYLYTNIDKQLLVIAESVRLILPEDYHRRAITADAISQAEYRQIETKLTALAERSGAKYVWTDILLDGTVYLTSCNRTPGPEKPEAEIYYFMPYQNGVSKEEMQAFTGESPVYATFADIWGNFRAVFVPVRNPDGSVYLACAEYTVDYVGVLLERSNLIFMTGLGFFLVGILPICLLYVHRSRKDQKLLEEKNAQLEQSREHLRTTLQSIGDGVVVTDSQGIICSINPAAEKLCGWNSHDAEGKPHEDILKFISTDDHLRVPSQVNDVLSSKRIISSSRNISLVTSDNRIVEIIDSAAPIMKEGSEEIAGVVLVIRDVTERNRMEEERRQSQKLQALGQLTGGIAHDVNNMLAGISGAAELLEKIIVDEPKATKYIVMIRNAIDRTSDLIKKLMAFSRKGKIVNTRVDVHAIILGTVALLERSIDRRIVIDADLEAGRCVVDGDPSQLQNGMLNLFLNARDAMPEGGKLYIATVNVSFDDKYCGVDDGFQPEDYVRISVQDTGHGIAPEIQDKIFEPFFSKKMVGKGTGLGLASVYGMAQEHNGAIRFYSEPGRGTVFHLYLPLSKSLPGPDTSTVKDDLRHGHGTILLVDDEEIIRQTGYLLLADLGYTVILAEDGAEAVAIYREKHEEIDGIILDIVMPVMNGETAFEHIRRINPNARVVISSGFTNDVNVNLMLDKGAAGYLMKPFNQHQLQKAMAGIMGV